MATSNFSGLNRKKTARMQSISKPVVRSSVNKKLEPKKVRKYIIQEWDNHPFAGWRDLDGTVRYTIEDAKKVLQEFKTGKWNYGYGTGKYLIHEYWEKESQPYKPKVLPSLKKSKAKVPPLTKVQRLLEQALKILNQIPSTQEKNAEYEDPIFR